MRNVSTTYVILINIYKYPLNAFLKFENMTSESEGTECWQLCLIDMMIVNGCNKAFQEQEFRACLLCS